MTVDRNRRLVALVAVDSFEGATGMGKFDHAKDTIGVGRIVEVRFRSGVVTKMFMHNDHPLANVRIIDTRTGKLETCDDPGCAGETTCPICSVNAWLPELRPWSFRDVDYYLRKGMISKELAAGHKAATKGRDVPVPDKATFAAEVEKMLQLPHPGGWRSEVVTTPGPDAAATDAQIKLLASREAVRQLDAIYDAIYAVLPESRDRVHITGMLREASEDLESLLDQFEADAKEE